MNTGWLLLLGVVVGWVFGWTLRGNLLSIYRHAFAHLNELENGLTNHIAIEPLIDKFRHWWYSNSEFLDIQTNEVLGRFFGRIQLGLASERTADDPSVIPEVRDALSKVRNALRTVTGQKRPKNRERLEQNQLARIFAVSQIPACFLATSFLFFQLSTAW